METRQRYATTIDGWPETRHDGVMLTFALVVVDESKDRVAVESGSTAGQGMSAGFYPMQIGNFRDRDA